jgi:hypothetical protein
MISGADANLATHTWLPRRRASSSSAAIKKPRAQSLHGSMAIGFPFFAISPFVVGGSASLRTSPPTPGTALPDPGGRYGFQPLWPRSPGGSGLFMYPPRIHFRQDLVCRVVSCRLRSVTAMPSAASFTNASSSSRLERSASSPAGTGSKTLSWIPVRSSNTWLSSWSA